MGKYVKVFQSILHSTVWQEGKDVKILWVTMLALANWDGVVEASIPGLANAAGLTIDETEKALEVLRSPDPYSRSEEYQGRRVEDRVGGFQILNYEKYRDLGRTKDYDRQYRKNYMRQYREKARKRMESEAGTLAKLLLDLIRKRKPDFKEPNLPAWAKEVDKMIRIDQRKPSEMEAVIRWCQGHDFWQNNILSAAKLRKQFDRLQMQMDQPPKTDSATDDIVSRALAVGQELMEHVQKDGMQE